MDLDLDHNYDLRLMTCAATLTQLGVDLGDGRGEMVLRGDDMTSFPTEHLGLLVSRVTHCVHIMNMRGCDLATVLNNVKSNSLNIKRQSLDSEETLALVQAMESRVERVGLYEEVTLDINTLMGYSGQGKCRRVELYWDTSPRYRGELMIWSKMNKWTVTRNGGNFVIERI